VVHAVDSEVMDSVPREFETEEAGEDDGDAGASSITMKRHYWEGIDANDGDSERNEVAAAGACPH
jgi:hypothetical protein